MNMKTLFFGSYALVHTFVFLNGMQIENEKEKTQYLYITFNSTNQKNETSVIASGISLLFGLYPEGTKNYNQLCEKHGIPQEHSLKNKIYQIFENLNNEFSDKIAIKKTICGQHADFFETSYQSHITYYIAFEFHTAVETEIVKKAFNNVFNNKTILCNELTTISKDYFEKLIPEKIEEQIITSFNLSGNTIDDVEKSYCIIKCNIL